MKKLVLLLALAMTVMSGCASKKPKKLKPGKPIPCPVKDC
jgi:uncharacterized protein YceK